MSMYECRCPQTPDVGTASLELELLVAMNDQHRCCESNSDPLEIGVLNH